MSDDAVGDGVHPDLDRLAEAAADVDVAADVREHVATCPQCAEALEAIRVTRDEVGALPEAAMPADVAARIDAALAEERQNMKGAGTVVPLDGARARRRRSGVLAGSVAASIVA